MAKGLKCRVCGDTMYADVEDYQPKGTWVTYVCRNGRCKSAASGYPNREKVFESN